MSFSLLAHGLGGIAGVITDIVAEGRVDGVGSGRMLRQRARRVRLWCRQGAGRKGR